MSKSDDDPNGCVMMLDDPDTVRRKFKRAVTDSGTEIRFDYSRPAITNLLTIYQLLTGKNASEVEHHFAGKGYAQLKEDLAEATIEFLRPIQERANAISEAELQQVLELGRDRASAIAGVTLKEVMRRRGIAGAAGNR